MVYMDLPHREVTLKLVYYGPALSGKTTNLQQLHAMFAGRTGSDLVTLNTRDDRTLFFDLLPLSIEAAGGLQIKLKLFTVPGQVIHNATRKIVLQGADGVAFIADSRVSATRDNNESFANLRANLQESGLTGIPTVIQFNKRDLPGIRSDADIAKIAAKGREPVFTGIALQGVGVAETFLGLAEAAWARLEEQYTLEQKFGVSPSSFLTGVRDSLPGVAR